MIKISVVFLFVLFAFAASTTTSSTQVPSKVDFARDVLPLIRQNCVGCHGPGHQEAGLRLDRRSSAMKSFSRRIVPGSSANSFVYHRVAGNEYGMQMPPTGPLRPEQIAIIRTWIDQGADWPDSLANEVDLPPANPKATALVESLRNDGLSAFMKTVTTEPALLNARGPEGSTPFMYAVTYASAATVAQLLKMGADPNKRNDANGTALMWAARDLDKTRLLLDHGADVNARSDGLRTPLMIAAGQVGGAPIVKLLLDKGAKPNPNTNVAGESSPLLEALTVGDASITALLIERGADAQATADLGLTLAVQTKCAKCLDMLAAKITDKAAYTLALQNTAVFGDLRAVRLMLDHGADVKAFDPLGRTALMYAAISDSQPVDVVKLLIERGADVNAIDQHKKSGDAGWTVLDIAKKNGETAIVQTLVKAGAKASAESPVALKPRRENTIRDAIKDSLPLLQRTDANFANNSGCISCHNNSLPAMTVGLARKRGFQPDEKTASAQARINVSILQKNRDKLHEGYLFATGDNFSDGILAYLLLGLHEENYAPDLNTDVAAWFILSRQNPNGEWPSANADTRQPLCSTYIGRTAIAMRSLQLYAPKSNRAPYDKAVQLAASWLAKAESFNNDDRSWRLSGLAWAGTDKVATQKARQELLATQRPDGGWADLASMQSTAYATGKSLVALQLSGLAVSDPAYQRGIKYLLSTQQEDGSWYVKTRALGFQPYFDAGFPHGYDQWMSAAGTSWSAMALTLALPEANAAKVARLR
jgi:ankyrin repeat protein